MSIWDKIKKPEFEEDEELEQEEPAPATRQQTAATANTAFGKGGAALELKVVRPEKFQNVTQIADPLLNRRTVVLVERFTLSSSISKISKGT